MTDKKFKSWTTKELNDLVVMHKAGNTVEKIAESMGRTTSAIRAKKEYLRIHGLIESTKSHWTTTQVKTAIEMHNAGNTHNEIAKAISRTRCAVTNMIQRLVEQGQIKKELTQ